MSHLVKRVEYKLIFIDICVCTCCCFQSVISLSDQLKHFKEYMGKLKGAVGEERANNIVSNSLHLVVAGSDDLANTYFTIGIRRAQYDISSYADLVVSSASSFIQVMYIYIYIHCMQTDIEFPRERL